MIPNAPYFTFTWYLRTTEELQVQHTHDFDEIIGFVGSDPDDPENLNGVVEFMVDGEWVVLERSACSLHSGRGKALPLSHFPA